MTAVIAAAIDLSVDAQTAWPAVTDWPSHSRWVAFTQVSAERGCPVAGVGHRFTGRTSIGPLHFDDPMEVTRWRPPEPGSDGSLAPGYCRIVKRGNLARGWAEITVTPRPGGCRVEWVEQVSIRGVPAFADPVSGVLGSRLLKRVLRRMAIELTA